MKRIDFILLLITILAGVICFFVGEQILTLSVSDIVLMGIYFAFAGLIITFLTNISVYKISRIKENIPSPASFAKSIFLFSTVAVIVMFLFGSLFQFLYSLQISHKSAKVDNYIMVIDNSGSMLDNDRDFKRYDALKEMFGFLDSKQSIGVYTFASYFEYIYPVKQITQDDINNFDKFFAPYKVSDGGTEITDVLNDIANLLETSPPVGKTSLVVISDGECEANMSTINKFQDLETQIHTVGVYPRQTSSELNKIAGLTGGNYYTIDNINELAGIFSDIYNLKFEHLLTGYRTFVAKENSYAFMRILFIFFLGLIIKFIQVLTVDIGLIRKNLIIQSILFTLTAGIIIEFFLQRFILSEPVTRLIVLILFALLIAPVRENQYTNNYHVPKKDDFDISTLKNMNNKNRHNKEIK